MRKVSLVLTMAAAVVALASTPAQASSVSCLEVSQQPGDRQFTVSPNAVLCLTGNGNLNVDRVNNGLAPDFWTTLDKSDDGNVNPGIEFSITPTDGNPLNGGFQFSPEVWQHWGRVIVAFKADGNGGINPDWAAFELFAGQTSGDWAISSGGLDHAFLYGADPAGNTGAQVPVPEPASLALLGVGLAVVVRQLRRKQ